MRSAGAIARVTATIVAALALALPAGAGAAEVVVGSVSVGAAPGAEGLGTFTLKPSTKYRIVISGTVRSNYPSWDRINPVTGKPETIPPGYIDGDAVFRFATQDGPYDPPDPYSILMFGVQTGATSPPFGQLRYSHSDTYNPGHVYVNEMITPSLPGKLYLTVVGQHPSNVTHVGGFKVDVLGQAPVVAKPPPKCKRRKARSSVATAAQTCLKELDLKYVEMDPRLEFTRGASLRTFDTPDEVQPDTYRVRIAIRDDGRKDCHEKLQYKFKVDGVKAAATRNPKDDCEYFVRVPGEGDKVISSRARDGLEVYEGDVRANIQDFLIVGIGDSAGSGEGSPGLAWEDKRCHRSSLSQQALAAKRIEDADDKSSVTFVHVACSGARIDTGLLGGYAGIVESIPLLPPQVDEVKRLVGSRPIDAIEMSMGVNQLRFGAIVLHCIDNDKCQDAQFQKYGTAAQFVAGAAAALPNDYAQLAPRLQQLLPPNAPASRIYVTEYPELLRGDDGELCSEVAYVAGKGVIDAAEVKFLDEQFAIPLANGVAAAAARHRWTLIRGAKNAFRTHGYCAKDRWIVRIAESLSNQTDSNGAMHPNPEGYRHMADFVYSKLRADLLPKGKPRSGP